MKKYTNYGIYDFADYAEELTGEALIIVNGGSCGGGPSGRGSSSSGSGGSASGSSCGGGQVSSNGSSYTGGSYSCSGSNSAGSGGCSGGVSGGCSGGGSYSCSGTVSSNFSNCGGGGNYSCSGVYSSGCGGGTSGGSNKSVVPTYTKQGTFVCGNGFTTNFGDHACAATSLLNELSEQYTKETGKTLTDKQIYDAMEAAVKAKHINGLDATIENWEQAANDMATSMGLKGTYKYTTDVDKADAIIYAWDYKGDPRPDHFVSDIGNGKYYDPYNGTIGDVSALTLATTGNGGYRMLDYSR